MVDQFAAEFNAGEKNAQRAPQAKYFYVFDMPPGAKQSKSDTISRVPATDRDHLVEDQVGHLLRRAHQRHCSLFSDTLKAELTTMQFAALAMIERHEQVSQNHLGRLTAMDPATIQGVVRRLAERALIVSASDPTDGRRFLWRLTPAGKRLLKKIIPKGQQISDETLAPLSASERSTFLRLLKKLT